MYNDALILIPSLDPDEKLLELIDRLKENHLDTIMVINDGSSSEYQQYFDQAKDKGCAVLTHAVNLGKGRALKTAFNEILNNYPEVQHVITVDSDGQHSIQDTIATLKRLREVPNAIVLGCRDFDSDNVPPKSKFGNKLTRVIMALFCGVKVTDTQTGLRGFHRNLLNIMLEIKGERFEYETNVLLEANTENIALEEVPIETIYYENNTGTHFDPIVDSIKIYANFAKFILSAVSSFALDFFLFSMAINMLESHTVSYAFYATIIARVCSSLYNYFINRNVVFKKKYKTKRYSFIKYYILVFVVMFISAFIVQKLVDNTPYHPLLLKAGLDIGLFFINYVIQKIWVFK